MALNYNLAKVYAISEDDDNFALQIVSLFITEVPAEIINIKEGVEEKDYKKTYAAAHKIKPTLDLLGMTNGFEEILVIMDWTKREGKRREIKDTVKSVDGRVEKAVKEIKKDFNL